MATNANQQVFNSTLCTLYLNYNFSIILCLIFVSLYLEVALPRGKIMLFKLFTHQF